MARQAGAVRLIGKQDEIVFYKTKDGYLARGVGSLDKKRVMKDPAFDRSRRASAAFKRAAQGAGLLRKAMGPGVLKLAESRLAGKLSARLMKVLKEDRNEWMDEKRVYNGNMNLLKGMPWDSTHRLDSVVKVEYRVGMDRVSGTMSISLDSFVPTEGLTYPDGATHFELVGSGAALDLERIEFEGGYASSGVLPLNGAGTGAILLNCAVSGGSTYPLVLGMGVMFYQEVNGEMNLLREGSAFEIVGVDRL